MHSQKSQAGMTMWSAAFVIGTLAFFLFLGFKLLPPYIEDMKVRSALDGLARDPGVASMSRADLIAALDKRFDIDSVTTVKPAQNLFLENRGKTRVIRVTYEAVVPLFYNISALLEFNHTREAGRVE